MKSRYKLLIILGVLCWMSVDAQTPDKLFIPYTQSYRVSDAGFRAAFHQLAPNDRQAPVCSSAMMGGATRVVYLSPPSGNTVTVKTTTCDRVDGGLSCAPLSEHDRYFFDTPDARFALHGGVSYDEAVKLLTAFRDHGIDGLPDEYKGFGQGDVTSISKDGTLYVLHLGERFCNGCTATLKVSLRGTKGGSPTLELAGDPHETCI